MADEKFNDFENEDMAFSGAWQVGLHPEVEKAIKKGRRPYGTARYMEYKDGEKTNILKELVYSFYVESEDYKVDGQKVYIHLPVSVESFDPKAIKNAHERLPLVVIEDYDNVKLDSYKSIHVTATKAHLVYDDNSK